MENCKNRENIVRTSPVELSIEPIFPCRRDFRIGTVGAGFIVREQQMVAYREMGLKPYAITSMDRAQSEEVAQQYNIPKVYDSWEQMLEDESIEILDIAVPPDCQLSIVQAAVQHPHIRGILCQKPLAMNLEEARKIVEACARAQIKLGVNSNMRYDPSIRALKAILDAGLLGQMVLFNINLHCIPHWQTFLHKYDRIEILNMGIHHVDAFRYLFGDPEKITALTRTDPRTNFAHIDGISQYTFQYADERMATSLDDVWAWPGEGCQKDFSIQWRAIGTSGLARGEIFWYEKNPVPSKIRFTTQKYPYQWFAPDLKRPWFPDAFRGTMAQLLRAVEEDREPEISGRDNLRTIAAVEACYQSIREGRTIQFMDFLRGQGLL